MKTYKLVFFGTPSFAIPALEAITKLSFVTLQTVVTQPDKPIGRSKKPAPPPIQQYALAHHLPTIQPDSLRDHSFIRQFKKLNPDLSLVVAYGKIIPKPLLEIPKFGWLNLHPSLLPRYRGASPIQAAILSGDSKTGTTLMLLDEGMDTGPIIAQKEYPLGSNENAEQLSQKLAEQGAQILAESLEQYLRGTLTAIKQNNTLATSTKPIQKDDGHLDWNQPNIFIERQILAYVPWPGTYSFMPANHGKLLLKILTAKASQEPLALEPGHVVERQGALLVGCGQGNLELLTIQLEGKKQQTAIDFLRGHPYFHGVQLT